MNISRGQLARDIGKHLESTQAGAWGKLKAPLNKLIGQFSTKDFFYLFAISLRWFDSREPFLVDGIAKVDKFGVSRGWSAAQFARLYLLLVVEDLLNSESFSEVFNQLFDTADVNELILLVQSLQFIPGSATFEPRAREAARSNIQSVFSALAHDSDYAFHNFDEAGWNQLILKAAFLAVPIWNIYGLSERNNVNLVQMLRNYAWERQEANRIVPWDLWICVVWLASEKDQEYLRKQFSQLDKVSRAAIFLALKENQSLMESKLIDELAGELEGINPNELTWAIVATLQEG